MVLERAIPGGGAPCGAGAYGQGGTSAQRGTALTGGSGNGKRPTVLIVDDEPSSLQLLRRTLRGPYRVVEARTGLEGLDRLTGEAVSAVVADHRMPGMTGVEFLAESWRRAPRTQRILLTGYAEAEDLAEAINAGQVFGYLAKPWHPDALLAMLRRAVETHRLLRDREKLLRDLEQKNAELERLLAKTRALQEARIQTERLATLGKCAGMVAHDLRNPLTAIRCMGTLLLEAGEAGPTPEDLGRRILGHVRSLQHYIDELLLFARPEAPPGERRPYPVAALTASLRESFAQRCQDAGVDLRVEVAEDVDLRIRPDQVFRVFENLLANGLEAAGPGGAVLLASGRRREGTVDLRVADSGRGVPPEVADTMFEPFVTQGKATGTGLGLAVVRKIVDEHGGRVWQRPWRLPGACFHVRLPAEPPGGEGAGCERPGGRVEDEQAGGDVSGDVSSPEVRG